MKKRLLSILMAVTMSMSCFTLSVSAEETDVVRWGTDIDHLTNYGTIGEAEIAIEQGEAAYVQLLSDVVDQILFSEGETVFDLNGHTITYDDKVMHFNHGAKILLTNSSEEQGKIVCNDEGYPDNVLHIGQAEVTVDDCDLLISSTGSVAVLYDNESRFHIKGGAYEYNGEYMIEVHEGTVKISGEPTSHRPYFGEFYYQNQEAWEGALLDLRECVNVNGIHIYSNIYDKNITLGTDILVSGDYSFYESEYVYEEITGGNRMVLCQTHAHKENLQYTDRGDGENHSEACLICGESWTTWHEYDEDGTCPCGYLCEHFNCDYENEGDFHTKYCYNCGVSLEEEHILDENGVCICGFGCKHPEVYYDFDDEYHYAYCSECYEEINYEKHKYGEDEICVCGYYEHEHVFDENDYDMDAYQHGAPCEICDVWVWEEHTYGEDGTCICGYHEHDHVLKEDDYSWDVDEHNALCEICNFWIWEEHVFGEDGTCFCGYYEHEHVVGDGELNIVCEYHEFKCQECGIWIYEDHEYVEDVCSVCERTRTSGVYIGDAHMEDKEYLDLDGNISESKPEGGYAYYENGMLTLHNYSYDGAGYEVEGTIDGIFTEHDLEIVLEGDNLIRCTNGDGIAVFYGTLKITGEGSLTVHGEDSCDGIDVYGDVVIDAKTLEIYSEDHGIEVDGDLLIKNGDIKVEAGDDGFDTDSVEIWNGTFDILAEDNGIDSDGDVLIRNGSFSIETRDLEGIEASEDIEIWNGTFDINANDDGLNADGTLYIKGGQFKIDAGCCGICTGDGIVLSDNVQITLPEDAKIGVKEKSGDDWYYVLDSEDEIVTLLEINSTDGMPYEDVTEADWFYDAVCLNYRLGIMTGMDATHFGPYGQLSRAQFALILYRMSDGVAEDAENPFKDIAGDEWYAEAVLWAAENGIVTGYQDGNFGPADYITREQMAVMMYRYAKYLEMDVQAESDYSAFKDAASVSPFAEDAIKWAFSTGIITGKENGTLLDPQGNTARAETAVIIQRFFNM